MSSKSPIFRLEEKMDVINDQLINMEKSQNTKIDTLNTLCRILIGMVGFAVAIITLAIVLHG